ncbi:MAG: peptidoglycan editing factor PgeF [Acidobacteria bacterium]|nr:peptidoglycan editing factor PgeF [Acidobacteriota bacterium]
MRSDNSSSRETHEGDAALPESSSAFHWRRETWGHALRALSLDAHTQHLFTSSQLRLPALADDREREYAWQAVTASLGVPRDRLRRVRQVHGRQVRVVRDGDASAMDAAALPDGDALVSNMPGLALAVVVADCVPVLVVDPRLGAAAAIHAGWRGTAAGITTAAIDTMAREWGTRATDLVAAIGPSIGPADYEVGESLMDAFRDAGHAASIDRWFTRRADGRVHLDLWVANRDQLEAAGVPPANIVIAAVSTAAHPGWLESYRRDGAAAGRLVAAVVVPRHR